MSKEIATQAEQGSNALMALIQRASTDATFDVAKLQQLLDVKDKWERTEARKAYVAAMTAFKANPPQIKRNKKVAYNNTRYSHATLDQVSTLIGEALSKHGIAHSWQVKQAAGAIEVTCTLTHSAGHSESVSMTAPADTSGAKNAIQSIGSAVTYLQRYSLLAATGMAVKDDDDGKTASGPAAPPIPGPTEVKTRITGSATAKIKGVFKAGEVFKVQADQDYFTKDKAHADAAKALLKDQDAAIIDWERDEKGTYWVKTIDRAPGEF